ncbi:hypothetical protein L198_02156 [Cryptococcus wingfieldii CBS 7118]|uniref:J domain-containing protein n=1 Tax=Cryptococcus wingfieldii CBS 7118 TaxID=1295528 RepID=A0A1E3JR09_9TREE|nr:hypothetical protein L198_02156 [Cryptococcus wingfieldii CBS 7118]ODO03311.1 hypothetical protein L198_02156 [Cryptococcus wingfieldii CBS 7118]
MPPTHYDLLEIQQDASSSEIRKAYLKAVLCSHPDKCPEEGREAATDLFRKVQEAYETLLDPEARSEYNNSLVINHGPPSDPLTEPRGPPGTYTTQSLFSERPVYPPHHMYTSASFTTPGPRIPVYTWHVYSRRPPWLPVSSWSVE